MVKYLTEKYTFEEFKILSGKSDTMWNYWTNKRYFVIDFFMN